MCVATNMQLNNYMNITFPGNTNIRLIKKEKPVICMDTVYAICSLGNNSVVSLYDNEDDRDAEYFKSCSSKISINVDLIKEFAGKKNVLRLNYINGLISKTGLVLDKSKNSSNIYCTPSFNTDIQDENCWELIDDKYALCSNVYEKAMTYFEDKQNNKKAK